MNVPATIFVCIGAIIFCAFKAGQTYEQRRVLRWLKAQLLRNPNVRSHGALVEFISKMIDIF